MKIKNPFAFSIRFRGKRYSLKKMSKELLTFWLIIFFIHTFIGQNFAIPTSSMEGSMLVGDKIAHR